MELYKPSFVEKFLEAHQVMLQGNAGLKPKPGENYAKPWQWPIDFRVSLQTTPFDFEFHFNIPLDHLILDRSPNIRQLMSRWELDKFKNF
jgi:hypothetical protein